MFEIMNNYWFVLGIFVAFCFGLLTGIRVTRNKIYLALTKKLTPEELSKVMTPAK